MPAWPSRRDAGGLLWWLFSLFIGPIATLLVVVLPKVPSEP